MGGNGRKEGKNHHKVFSMFARSDGGLTIQVARLVAGPHFYSTDTFGGGGLLPTRNKSHLFSYLRTIFTDYLTFFK